MWKDLIDSPALLTDMLKTTHTRIKAMAIVFLTINSNKASSVQLAPSEINGNFFLSFLFFSRCNCKSPCLMCFVLSYAASRCLLTVYLWSAACHLFCFQWHKLQLPACNLCYWSKQEGNNIGLNKEHRILG